MANVVPEFFFQFLLKIDSFLIDIVFFRLIDPRGRRKKQLETADGFDGVLFVYVGRFFLVLFFFNFPSPKGSGWNLLRHWSILSTNRRPLFLELSWNQKKNKKKKPATQQLGWPPSLQKKNKKKHTHSNTKRTFDERCPYDDDDVDVDDDDVDADDGGRVDDADVDDADVDDDVEPLDDGDAVRGALLLFLFYYLDFFLLLRPPIQGILHGKWWPPRPVWETPRLRPTVDWWRPRCRPNFFFNSFFFCTIGFACRFVLVHFFSLFFFFFLILYPDLTPITSDRVETTKKNYSHSLKRKQKSDFTNKKTLPNP